MDTKNMKIYVSTNETRTDIYGLIVNGAKYARDEKESISEFFGRVNKDVKANQGFSFIDFYKNPANRNNIISSSPESRKAEKAKKIKKYEQQKAAKSSLRKKIAAFAITAVLATTAFVGASHLNKFSKPAQASAASQTEQSVINEDNAKLKTIYESLMETKHGQTIVAQLQAMDKWQENYNIKMAKYPDADGDVLFLKAREVSAVQDMSNATNTNFISLDYDDTRFCDYLEAASYTTPGLYVSEKRTGEYKLIKDKEVKEKMLDEENFAISAIKGNETTSSINKHFKGLQETGLTYTEAGVNTAYLGEGSNIVIADEGQNSKELEKFIEMVKTNNSGANKLDSYAKAKLDLTDKQRTLIDDAYKIMDQKNIQASLETRDKFDMETTEKGLKVHAAMVGGGYLVGGIGGSSSYTYVTKSGKTIKISRAEAIKKFGQDAVKEAEKKADSTTKVDTNGDGKPDTYMDDANKKEQQKKKELEEQARQYSSDYAQGQSDGYAGRSKAKSTAGYNAGYANGVKKRNAANEKPTVVEEEVIHETQPLNQQLNHNQRQKLKKWLMYKI